MASVKTAKKLLSMGYPFTPGSKVSWIVTNSNVSPAEVEPYIDGIPFTKTPDWEYYAERLAATLGRVTEAFGWSEKQSSKNRRQSVYLNRFSSIRRNYFGTNL